MGETGQCEMGSKQQNPGMSHAEARALSPVPAALLPIPQTGSLWLGHRCYKQMLQDWNPTSVSNSVLFLLYPTALNKM